MRKCPIITFSVLILIICGSGRMAIAQSQPSTPLIFQSKPSMSLLVYLYSVCPSLGCHVTFEERIGSDLIDAYIQDDQNVSTLKELVSLLEKSIPSAKIYDDNGVIRIVDARLHADTSYVMNDVLISVSYSGTLNALPDALGKRLDNRLRTATFGSLTMLNYDDFTSLATLSAKNETVRSILTRHLPLQNYACVLWSAETLTVDHKEVTYVRFWRPAKGENTHN